MATYKITYWHMAGWYRTVEVEAANKPAAIAALKARPSTCVSRVSSVTKVAK